MIPLLILTGGWVAGCDGREGARPLDWPAPVVEGGDFGLEALAPATAELTVVLDGPGEGGDRRVRRDVRTFTLASPDDGRILHETVWRQGDGLERRDREEAVIRAGRLATRTVGPGFVARPDLDRWRHHLGAPQRDWRELARALGAAAAGRTLVRDAATGAVTAAALAGTVRGVRVTLAYAARRAEAGLQIPAVEAERP